VFYIQAKPELRRCPGVIKDDFFLQGGPVHDIFQVCVVDYAGVGDGVLHSLARTFITVGKVPGNSIVFLLDLAQFPVT